jgi:hypothetical protein
MDGDFEDYVPLLSQAMLWCAVQDYRSYCQEGLKHLPKVIVDETSTYWEENDAYDLFIREKLVKEVINDDGDDLVNDIVIDIETTVVATSMEPVETVRRRKTPNKKKEVKYTTELLMTDLYRVFKIWVKEAFPGLNPIPDQPTVRTEMVQRLGPQKNRKWLGWTLKEEEKNMF